MFFRIIDARDNINTFLNKQTTPKSAKNLILAGSRRSLFEIKIVNL